MDIEMISIKDLKPYEKNAKKHPKEQVNKIANSIKQFGMNDPIAVWGKENIIIEGHGRLQALKKLGYKEVPIIRLDHLTDEERKAYTLAHNSVAESEWDFDLLRAELGDITDINMSDFGFDLNFDESGNNILKDDELEIDYAEETQKKVEGILNLNKANFVGVGKYDIPQLEPVYEIPPFDEWIGFNYVLSDNEPERKAVHFFIDDYQFERIWNNPNKYVDKLKRYACVLTPDFSPYCDMPLITQMFNHYRKHWVGAYMQAHGVRVIPTIRASADERSLEWFLDGEPKGGIVCISSMWTKEEEARDYFVNKEYKQMYEKLKPSKIYVYGNEVEGLSGNIEYIDTFAKRRFLNG